MTPSRPRSEPVSKARLSEPQSNTAAERSSAVKLEPTLSWETPAWHTVHLSSVDLPENHSPVLLSHGEGCQSCNRNWKSAAGATCGCCVSKDVKISISSMAGWYDGEVNSTPVGFEIDRVLVQTQSCLIVCSNTVPHLFVFSLREVLVVRDVWKHIRGVYVFIHIQRTSEISKDLWNYQKMYTVKHKITILKKRFRLIDLLWVFQPYLWKKPHRVHYTRSAEPVDWKV